MSPRCFTERMKAEHGSRSDIRRGRNTAKRNSRCRRRESYQLLDFVEIKQEIEESTIVDPPQNESQTRALKSVPADKRAEVWKEALEAAGGGQVSGTDVEAAGIKVSQSKQRSLRFPANFAMRFEAPSRRPSITHGRN